MQPIEKLFAFSEAPENIRWREERAPLGALCYLLNIIGIIGNVTVLHIFRLRMPPSNYRVFVMSLSVLDLNMCIIHLLKEFNRTVIIYRTFEDILETHICAFGNFGGYLSGVSAVPIVLFITFERYRKICTPFKPQLSIKRCKIMCLVSVLVSLVTVAPVYEMYGVRFVKIGNVIATRCAIKNKYDGSVFPFVFSLYIYITAVIVVICIIVFQIKIRNALIEKAKSKMRMKNIKGASGTSDQATVNKTQSVEDQEAAKNRRIAVTFAIVSVMLVISFFTLTIFHLLKDIERFVSPSMELTKVEDVINEYVPDAVILNGILNPFVYFFTDNQFRQEVYKACGR